MHSLGRNLWHIITTNVIRNSHRDGKVLEKITNSYYLGFDVGSSPVNGVPTALSYGAVFIKTSDYGAYFTTRKMAISQ